MNFKAITAALAGLMLSLAGLSLESQASNAGPERLFLQQVSSNSAVVKWRTAIWKRAATAR